MIDREQLLESFLRYVRVDTQANESMTDYPSSPGQLDLGRMLTKELQDLGLADVEMTDKGIVYATVPATVDADVPTVAFFAHLDTSPETSGKNVNPQVIHDYDGEPIALTGDTSKVIRHEDNADLAPLKGQTLIVTDGTTLLGADNKAGVAAIMQAVVTLVRHSEIKHGPVRVCFTCDEEIGHGVDHVDLAKLSARVGYTLDGHGTGEIEAENFSADKAVVTVKGVNIHPSIGKDRMVNAIRAAGTFLDRLPRDLSPERTEGKEGFVHPYQLAGGVAEVTIDVLLRDFRTSGLAEKADMLRALARDVESEHPGTSVAVDVKRQYRNMAEGMTKEPRAVPLAEEAMKRAGLSPKHLSLRGGTDGAVLTELGLPCPNLSTGEHNPHSPLEWTCLEEMETAAKVVIELAQLWAAEG